MAGLGGRNHHHHHHHQPPSPKPSSRYHHHHRRRRPAQLPPASLPRSFIPFAVSSAAYFMAAVQPSHRASMRGIGSRGGRHKQPSRPHTYSLATPSQPPQPSPLPPKPLPPPAPQPPPSPAAPPPSACSPDCGLYQIMWHLAFSMRRRRRRPARKPFPPPLTTPSPHPTSPPPPSASSQAPPNLKP